MSRQPLLSLQANQSIAQLLALNAMFEAARAGEAGRASAGKVQTATQLAQADMLDPVCDALLDDCYAALMEGSARPPRLS